MRLILLESDRRFLQTAEYAAISILVHAGVVWFGLAVGEDGWRIPTTEREARVVFLLPPDRVDTRSRQFEIIQWGKLGSDLEDGKLLTTPDEGLLMRERAFGARKRGAQTGARGAVPFGPPPRFVPDTAFSVLEVDKTAERYDNSAAPIYPPELIAMGMEGLVHTIYVVDSTGIVDTTTVEVVSSNDPRFTKSVRNSLGLARFRPAIRAGHKVRQLVEQRFRFRIVPPSQLGQPVS